MGEEEWLERGASTRLTDFMEEAQGQAAHIVQGRVAGQVAQRRRGQFRREDDGWRDCQQDLILFNGAGRKELQVGISRKIFLVVGQPTQP